MYLLFATLLIAADQATKLWAARAFALGEELELGLGFYLTHVRNTGAAFSMFQDGSLILGILSALISGAVLFYLLRHAKHLPLLQVSALTLIFAGAVGNMIDRFRLGYVIDFIHFKVPGFDFPVFNLADMCVVIGAALLLLSSFFADGGQEKQTAEERALNEPDFFESGDMERYRDLF